MTLSTNEKLAGTPESMPSVAATSQASSDDNDDGLARELFSDEGEESDSEISVATSDDTVVASSNLSSRSLVETSKEEEVGQGEAIATSDGEMLQQEPLFTEEAPEEEVPSCNGALRLTPKQLAEMFLVFDGARKMWPVSRKDEAASEESKPLASTALSWIAASPADENGAVPGEMEWKQTAQKLEEECQALKKIVRLDVSRIFELNSELEAQRKLNTHRSQELEILRIEHGAAVNTVDALKKERDVYRERESELLGTIAILKEEIDKATKVPVDCSVDNLKHDYIKSAISESFEMKQLQLNNQLFASQISENEVAIAELRTEIDLKTKSNTRLTQEIESLQQRLESQNELIQQARRDDKHAEITETTIDSGDIMKAISARLELMERERIRAEETLREELKQKESDIDEIRSIIKKGSQQNEERSLTFHQNHQEIEVFLARHNPQQDEYNAQTEYQKCCCDQSSCNPWVALSDDFSDLS